MLLTSIQLFRRTLQKIRLIVCATALGPVAAILFLTHVQKASSRQGYHIMQTKPEASNRCVYLFLVTSL